MYKYSGNTKTIDFFSPPYIIRFLQGLYKVIIPYLMSSTATLIRHPVANSLVGKWPSECNNNKVNCRRVASVNDHPLYGSLWVRRRGPFQSILCHSLDFLIDEGPGRESNPPTPLLYLGITRSLYPLANTALHLRERFMPAVEKIQKP